MEGQTGEVGPSPERVGLLVGASTKLQEAFGGDLVAHKEASKMQQSVDSQANPCACERVEPSYNRERTKILEPSGAGHRKGSSRATVRQSRLATDVKAHGRQQKFRTHSRSSPKAACVF